MTIFDEFAVRQLHSNLSLGDEIAQTRLHIATPEGHAQTNEVDHPSRCNRYTHALQHQTLENSSNTKVVVMVR